MFELNQLYNMDCMDGMRKFPDEYFELAIVDPPYRDENQPTKTMRRKGGKMRSFGGKPDHAYFAELFRVSKNQIIWGVNNFRLFNYSGFVVWEKLTISETFTLSMAEIAYLSAGLGSTSKIFKHIPQDAARIHPTQKPVALYKWLLHHYARPGDKILDTHVGSASSLVAAHSMGFTYIGFEIDTDYFAKAVERIEIVKAQGRLFQQQTQGVQKSPE